MICNCCKKVNCWYLSGCWICPDCDRGKKPPHIKKLIKKFSLFRKDLLEPELTQQKIMAERLKKLKKEEYLRYINGHPTPTKLRDDILGGEDD